MSIKHCLARFDQKMCIFVVFLCVCATCELCMSQFPNYMCDVTDVYIYDTTPLQHQFELLTPPSIPSNDHVGCLC